MRRLLLPLLFWSLLVACAQFPTLTPSPPPSSTTTFDPTNVGIETQALGVSILPDISQSFHQVIGRAPVTVTFGARVSGGVPPYQYAWDFDGSGKTTAAGDQPRPFVFTQAGEYQASVTVTDRTGSSARGTRRIVVLGGTVSMPSWTFGVTAHLERRRAGYYPTLADVTRAAELMQAAGVQAARIDFNWDMLNPARAQWNFQDYDAMVQIVRAHNVEILGIVDYSSWWASSAQSSNDWRVRLYSEPSSDYEFASYTYQVVSHFKNDVRVWEIWNEPNTVGFWKPQPDAGHYAQLLQESYLAAKYADPNAVLVLGGLSGNGIDGDDKAGLATNFLAAAYANGARGYFDVMAIHPYLLPNSGIAALRGKVAATRAVMDRYGDAQVPLWITEIGAPDIVPWWPTAPVQTEAEVAAWLEQVYTGLPDQTPAIFWYDWQDQGIGDQVEQHFGLLRLDFSAKPAYDRYRALAGKANSQLPSP